MYEIAQNRFSEGVSKDVSALVQKDTTALHLHNIELFTKENQTFAATNIKGTKLVFMIPFNHIVLASKTYGNVCYMVLGEVVNGQATGKGQIGCFPSPDYTKSSGTLEPMYKPFNNYGGDQGQFPQKNGPFISALFNFSSDKNMDLVIQPSYDGSVNVIMTDGKNPMRIVNSAFSSVNGETFEMIVRSSGNEDNRYNAEDFENRLNLNLFTKTIAKIGFQGVFSGGQVKAGNYRYYFKYATADGNETFFFGQSGLVQIAPGTSLTSISGGKGDGENTDKQVRFLLERLDDNYASVVVYFVHSSGENSTVETVYRLANKITIRNGKAFFTHSGFENLDTESSDVLTDVYGQVDTADTLTEVQGYLIAGGIKQKAYDRVALKDFARNIRLIHQTKEMDAGLNPFTAALFKSVSDSVLLDFYNLGYLNPLNAYHGVGYWGGEAVPFGIRLILNNGELSDVYPVLGVDNLNGSFSDFSYTGQNFNLIDQNEDGFNSTQGFNTKGIYRFPKRSVTGFYNHTTDTFKVNGIRYVIPAVPQSVKDIAKGLVFVRAERKKNALQQGILIDTFKVPLDQRTNYTNDNGAEKKLSTYADYDTLYKIVPAPGMKLEASFRISAGKERAGTPGVHYAHFADNYGKYRQGGGYQDSFAFLSGENFCEFEKSISEFARRNVIIQPLEAISFLHEIKTSRASSGTGSDSTLIMPDHFSVLVPKSHRNIGSMSPLNARTTYVIGGLDESIGSDMFSSACYFMDMDFSKGHSAVFPLEFDDYIGIRLTGPERFNISGANGKTQRMEFLRNNYLKTEEMAYLVTLYGEGGLWSTNTLKQNYLSLSDLLYTEISERMSWDDLEAKLDAGRGITLFGGDCFITPNFRKLYHNRFEKNEVVDEDRSIDSIKQANVGITIGWFAESNYNTALRVPLFTNLNSSEPATFAPYGKDNQSTSDETANNSWRRTRIAETKGFNHGYKKTNAHILGILTDFDRPFNNNDWYSRLMNSSKHVPNAFVNGYRQWGFDYQDYDASKGRITRIVPFGNDLLMIQEDGISVVPINQRMETSGDAAGSVFIESTEVLSPYQGYKSHYLGSQHPDSIIQTENGIYGYDAKRFTWWVMGMNGQLKSISDLKISSDLLKRAKVFSKNKFNKFSSNVVAGWDVSKREVYLSFYNSGTNLAFTVGYSELGQIHTGEKDYHARHFLSVNHKTYGVPLFMPRQVFEHDSDQADRLHIYGYPRKAVLRFVVNKQQEANKVFDFIEIVSNNVLPDRVLYWIQGASANQLVKYDSEDIIGSNAKYREEKAVINIPRVDWVDNQSVTEYLGQQADNAVAQVFNEGRVRGKVMVIELQYSTNRLLELSSVLTYYRKSLR